MLILEFKAGTIAIVIITVIIIVKRPLSLLGVISPNPTVVNVIISKYNIWIYRFNII